MSEQKNTPQAPRIAIKFGASSSASKPTVAPKKQAPSKPSSALGKRQRSHAFGHDSDSGEDDGTEGTHEYVTTFGSNGAENEAEKKRLKASNGPGAAPLVIGGHKNRDWKSEMRTRKGGKNLLPHEVRAQVSNEGLKETEPADQDKEIKWGLSLPKKESPEASTAPAGDAEEKNGSTGDAVEHNGHSTEQVERPDDPDDDAMNALLGKKRKAARDFIIDDASKRDESLPLSEQDAYQRGYQEAADVSTIDEYEAIPDGEFGAAMLRGMGWKGEERAPKPKAHVRRPHLMGLGAKEDEELKKAEVAKKNRHRSGRPRLDEYRTSKESERRTRETQRPDSYKSERDRERPSASYGHRNRARDRDHDRDRNRDREQNRDGHKYRDDRHHRR
ncbi:hypothetical protein SLS62_007125 [Diatrype stigma]|uniref:Pre-mRNA-splicing factor n=1 Tax=Diatrype stigma TaxID=117547 RepID=A0AAN9YQN9_9PEZI